MSRLNELFKKKQGAILSIYCTAGFPRLDSTREVMRALQLYGADIIELGMPYSDPLADGPVIQRSSAMALSNGMTIPILFEQIRDMRKEIRIPVLLMGYLNPVLQYGFEKFCADAAQAGVDGLILPDLPAFEYQAEYGPVMHRFNLDFIFLVTPETPDERVRELDGLSNGFLYAVSASSTTGGQGRPAGISAYLSRLKSLNLRNPVLVGFGIGNKTDFDFVCRQAAGAIIGSAYIRALEKSPDVKLATKNFLSAFGE